MLGFITYILISVFTPGPNNIFASISSARSGIKKSMSFMLGIWLGTSIIFVLTGLFNVFLYQHIRIITQVIGVVGGLFIIYLAARMFMSRADENKLLIQGDRLFFMAVILNFINAKTIIFGLTVATFYLEMGFSVDYMFYFALLMGFLCFIAVLVWGLFGKIFRDFLTRYRIIYNIVMSLLLAYSGVIVIIESVS